MVAATDDDLRLLWRRFVHRSDTFVKQWYSKEKQEGGYYPAVDDTVDCPNDPPCEKRYCRHRPRLPLGKADLDAHLGGRQTVGVYQLKDDKVKWLCFDVDLKGDPAEMGLSDAETLAFVQGITRQMARLLQGYGLPFIVETSGSKGYHLWVFFEQLVSADEAMSLGVWLRDQVEGFSKIGAEIIIEVFPKQSSTDSYGNLVKLPLGTHRKTGKKSLFVNHLFKPFEDQWQALRAVQTVTPEQVAEMIEDHSIPRLSTVREQATYTAGAISVDEFNSLPCFINLMNEGTVKGQRDTPAFMLACYLRSRGVSQQIAVAGMEEWNNTLNDPPMERSYLLSKIDSAYSQGYPPIPCREPMFDRYCETGCRLYGRKCQTRGLRQGEGARA
jgi:hypothetical protein